ncbi:MAG: DUF6436 domain-containing protein [Aestuariibacter sp.]
MRVLTQKPVLFTFIWLMLSFLALWSFSSNKTTAFDTDGRLALAASKAKFDAHFTGWVKQYSPDLRDTTVHFTAGDCWCEHIAAPHINSVKQLTQEQNGKNIDIKISGTPQITSFIPATPAVAVFNKQEQLVYFGPYSTGLFCTQSNGLVEKFIAGQISPQIAATVLMEANGCYCAT